jgi:citrate lyase subunit beta/citryl-CoA lyase
LRRAFELATAHVRVKGLQLGLGDLFEPLGIARRETAAIQQAMFALSMAAGEAGVFAYDSAFADIRDQAGFRTEALLARSLGFIGKSCIHPSQIALANEVFQPTPDEITHAQRVVEAAAEADAAGRGAYVVDGKMIDGPFVARARAIVAQAALNVASGAASTQDQEPRK